MIIINELDSTCGISDEELTIRWYPDGKREYVGS